MDNRRAVVELKKYSWADTDGPDGKPSYEHLIAKNLCLILEWSNDERRDMVLAIVQGTSTLNKIDLGKHIDIATQTRCTFATTGRSVSTKQLPTYAIASQAKLAITHRTDDGKVHRMQVAFSTFQECDDMVAVLKARGLAFAEASRTTRTSTVDTDRRPLTAATGRSIEQLSQSPYNLRNREISRKKDVPPVKAMFGLSSTSSHGFNNIMNKSPSNNAFFVRDEQIAPRSLTSDLPSHIYTPKHQTYFMSGSLPDPSQPHFLKTTSISNKINTGSRSASTSAIRDHNQADTTQSDGLRTIDTIYDPSISLLSEPLPPKRDHTFDKQASDRSRSSSLSMPPLPVPRFASAQGCSSTAKAGAETQMSNNKRRYTEIGDDDAQTRIRQRSESLIKEMLPPPPRTSSSLSKSSPKTMSELLYGKARNQSAASILDQQSTRLPAAPLRRIDASSEEQITSCLDNDSEDASSLQQYFSLSEEQRLQTLERHIVSILKNTDFLKLCEEVSACWHRMALDL